MKTPARLLGVAISLAASPASLSHPGPRSMPLTICGITAGKSVDSEVTKRFGKGYFVADEDHLGGRYYVDPKHRVTLHTTIGVDRLIFTVELSEGVRLPTKSAAALKRAETKTLKPPSTLFRSLRLGDTAALVTHQIGKPAEHSVEHGMRTLRYRGPAGNDSLDYQLEFRFRRNRLTSVFIYNGE